MSQVFLAQPLRHFVHGFILFGTQLQLWVFDRSGPYCESIIDIGMMSDKEHGIDSNIRYDDDEIIIKMKIPGSNVMQEFSLDLKPLVCQSALVSRGTTVYSSIDKKYVVKFSWKICGKTSEVELLKVAKDVVGMAKLIGWRDLVQTSTLRKGLTLTQLMVKCTRPAEKVLTTPVVLSGNSVQYLKKSTSKAESRKRKSESEQAGAIIESVSKRTRSGTKEVPRSVPVVEIRSRPTGIVVESGKTTQANESLDVAQSPQRRSSRIEELRMSQSVGGKRKIQENVDVNDRLKRVHLSSHREEAITDENDGPNSSLGSESNQTRTTEASEESMMSFTSDFILSGYKIERAECVDIRKRQQAAVAISPIGKPINDFNTPLEVVIGLRDAIKAHRSLFIDAKILHRDISVNNILLKICDDPKDYGGILIDLDLAALFKDGKTQGKLEAMTGTMQFMALEILKNSFAVPGAVVSHSYRHDLESFFYVLLWICIRYGWPDNKSPHLDFLRKWYSGTAEEIDTNKKMQMKPETFGEEVYERISPMFKNVEILVRTFWRILFRKGENNTSGTAADLDSLYSWTINAFEKTTLKLK
ncbi:BgTH12-03400 [Blumeria graminis f. sp. triticale]|uniref:non-specific serine/threonine protein kinase n=1 Tax=Blumeria graminis f. sp. triticale TaxID=1689686 RepID=A0A9W4GCY2_BLUGR|nr:BgTH12-03400 [Blumeria graminis f. sp. triticale]